SVYPELASAFSPLQIYDGNTIVAIAQRLQNVLDATLFKWDKGEGLAPAQQAINRARAMKLAKDQHPEDPGLHGVIERVYAVLVPESVAIQQNTFSRTRLLPEEWNFGPIDLAA
ncbi:MAG: hypothetical protein ACMG6E_07880, partial [Candidatus Roizmanbacteria bacterium]